MKQMLGLIIGAGLGGLIGFYARLMGLDFGVALDPTRGMIYLSLSAALVGAIVGVSVAIRFSTTLTRKEYRGAQAIIGAIGGTASGALLGGILSAGIGAAIMIALGFRLEDEQSIQFAGAMGGGIIGSFAGGIMGLGLGAAVGLVVGFSIGSMRQPKPAEKPDLVIPDQKESDRKKTRRRTARPSHPG